MGHKRLDTISAYMSYGSKLTIKCLSCGHRIELDPAKTYWFFIKRRWSTKILDAKRRFRCSECDQKRIDIYPGGLV
ncbi:hypothetical protein [Aurantiacibacter gangjinensis]|nr:hypothetical protein [Aurantiacibacter gangjinensis]